MADFSMQTDKLFHEYFQTVPQALFELLQIEPQCAYRYISPVVKAAERRLDGFLAPELPGYPYYFIEVQGYRDSLIYWRTITQVGLSHEQNRELGGQNWRVIVLFLDAAYDPGIQTLGPLSSAHEQWLTRKVLPDVLTQMSNASPVLNVLRPLATKQVEELQQQGARWVEEIRDASEFDEATEVKLVSLLVQFVAQRFIELPREEIDRMLKLTPFEETRAGKQYIEEGLRKGLEQGLEQGLQVAQRARREDALMVLQLRFSQVDERITQRIEQIDSLEQLKTLFEQALTTESLEQFEQLLLTQ